MPRSDEALDLAAETAIPEFDEEGESSANGMDEVGETSESLFEAIVSEGTPLPTRDKVNTAATIASGSLAGEEIVLVYRRSGGLVGLDEEIVIYKDGRLTSSVGREWQVDASEVELLVEEIEELGFFELDGNYMPEDPCCDRFMYGLSVYDGDKVHMAETADAAPGVPDELWLVLDVVQGFIADQIR